MTVIIFLIVLAVLIFAHELGHFLVARWCGIRVDSFAIGFGPRILHWQGKETEYSIRLIPFGGFVKIFGEDPTAEAYVGPHSARSFIRKPKWQQVVVLVAGVLFNFLFAALLYSGVFMTGVTASPDGFAQYASHFSDPRIIVSEVLAGSPADKAGLQAGDIILRVIPAKAIQQNRADGPGIQGPTTNISQTGNAQSIAEIQDAINSSANNPVTIDYSRGSASKTIEVTPNQGLVPDKYAIGIAMDDVVSVRLPVFSAIYEGLHYTLIMIKETAVGLYAFIATIFQGTANFSQVTGPVGIAGIVGDAAQLGFTYLVMITALISINLGVINLIPFPALDGGRVLFIIIESVIRRPIPARLANTVNAVGFVLLMILMVAVTYKDIWNLVK